MELRKAEEEISRLQSLYVAVQSHAPDLPALSHPPESSSVASTPADAWQSTEAVQQGLTDMEPLMLKFQKRTTEKDPITEKPRYGEKTLQRVLALLANYRELVEHLGHESLGMLQEQAQTQQERDQQSAEAARLAEQQAQKEAELEEARRKADEERQRQEEQLERERQLAEQIAQEREARRLIEEARRAAALADQQWMDGIAKGPDGIRLQLDQLLSHAEAKQSAIPALHTLFTQIVARPEEVNYRRIRRDHPQFQADIGRFDGGREVLIAAGFVLGYVDEVPSFVCKEPNVEQDLDGWSAWFDGLKATVEILEEYLLK